MSAMGSPAGWGPSHQTGQHARQPAWFIALAVIGLIVWFLVWRTGTGFAVVVLAPLFVATIFAGIARAAGWSSSTTSGKMLARSDDPLAAVRELRRKQGGGVYLGVAQDGGLRFARAQRAVLLLGPPRSGKTTAVIIPSLIAHDGPAVSTSTKLDVAVATRPARQQSGRLWEFDPIGTGSPSGFERLRWSPVRCSRSWEGALLMARATTAGVGVGTMDTSHWAKRSQALLAPMLHAAALDGRDMESVVDWVMRHELDEAGVLLEQDAASRMAFASLLGILNTEDRRAGLDLLRRRRRLAGLLERNRAGRR